MEWKQNKPIKAISLLGLLGFLIWLFGLRKIGTTFQNPQAAQTPLSLLMTATANQELNKLLSMQSAHETAFWTSNIFKSNNNLFGMKPAKVRANQQHGEYNGYASFNDYDSSIVDMLLWLNYNKLETSGILLDSNNPFIYVSWLKQKGFFTDSIENYLNGMINAKNKLKI